MDEPGTDLARVDRPEVPRNSDGSGKITLGGGECIGSSGSLEEEEREEDEHFGPDTGALTQGRNTKGLECGENDENGCPPVVEGERKVDEKLVTNALRGVVFLDNVVDVSHGGAHKESEDEGKDVMLPRPQSDICGIENAKESETPGNTINDHTLSGGEELVDDGSEEKEMDEGPNEIGP